MKRRFDNQVFGLMVGLILPIIGALLYFFVQRAYMSGQSYELLTFETYKEMLSTKRVLASILTMGLLLNLVVFFVANYLNKLRLAQGVVAITIIYAFIIVVLKFF